MRSKLPIAVGALLVLALSGCATEPSGAANEVHRGAAPYVGVFTGEYLDGKPLYRFPAIEVVGSRRDTGGM